MLRVNSCVALFHVRVDVVKLVFVGSFGRVDVRHQLIVGVLAQWHV